MELIAKYDYDRLRAALELMQHKALKQMAATKSTCTLDEDDINEVLLVAGMPVLTPDSLKAKTLEVII